jgi:hypothetical protein
MSAAGLPLRKLLLLPPPLTRLLLDVVVVLSLGFLGVCAP